MLVIDILIIKHSEFRRKGSHFSPPDKIHPKHFINKKTFDLQQADSHINTAVPLSFAVAVPPATQTSSQAPKNYIKGYVKRNPRPI